MFWPRWPRIASRASSLSGRSSTSRMLTRSSARAGVPRVAPTGSAVTCTSGGPLISSHLAVEALGELLVMRFVWSEPRRFLQAQPQEPEADEAVVEEAMDPVLQGAVEIDEHVPADDEVEVVERPVGAEGVLREHDVAAQLRVQHRPVVAGLVPARAACPPAPVAVMPGGLAPGRKGQLAALGLPHDGVLDVGGVQPAAI